MSGIKNNGEKDKKENKTEDKKDPKEDKKGDKVGDKNEEDCDCFVDNRTPQTCPPVRNVTHPLRYYEFTQEEMKALEECDRESFYKRCLPFSTLFATATFAAIKYEFLKRNPHFGAVPKVLVAAIVGYCCGRLSYMSVCDQKLRTLPANSHLGNIMRKYHADSIAAANKPPKDSKQL